jgi:hypothetical protein
MMRRNGWLALMILVAGTGCKPSESVSYQTWFKPAGEIMISDDASMGYEGMVRAGRMAVLDDGLGAKRVHFDGKMRAASIAATSKSIDLLSRSLGSPIQFEYRALGTDEIAPELAGWRLQARVIVWRLSDACETLSIGDIEKHLNLGTKFAFALMQGSAVEADLGLTLLDDLRNALVPHFGKLTPGMLASIATITERNLPAGPWLESVLENERQNMLASVQMIQDAYRKDELDGLDKRYGSTVRDAVQHMHHLKAESGSDQTKYFQGLGAEVDAELGAIRTWISLPKAEREEIKHPDPRPWRRLARHTLQTLRPLVDKADATLCKTRLFVLTCRIKAQVRSQQLAPPTLTGFPEHLITDPYSGHPFGYDADGPSFKLYSVGLDLRDSGGESDETGTTPDMVLEGH